MKLAIIMGLAPRKLGSFERWILAICKIAHERGHHVDLYGRDPIHPDVKAELDRLGAGWGLIRDIERSLFSGVKVLAQYDAIHLNLCHPRSRVALQSYFAWRAKTVFVDHTSGVASDRMPPRGLRGRLRRMADLFTLLRTHSVAGVSDYVTKRARHRYRWGPRRICTIYNGVDVETYASGERRSSGDELTVTTVCWLRKDKGVDVLIRGFAQSGRNMRLRIAGDGPELENLQSLTQELGISSRVSFEGLRDDIDQLLKETDIFVHPAVWDEAFGLTITEAMATELAVIATRAGGIPEIIEHEKNGLLVTPGSAEEIADALNRLAASATLRVQLGKAARRRVQERFELWRCAREHVECCEAAVGSFQAAASLTARYDARNPSARISDP
jgi:glycosyltransferase involved in cell wall biosynthesis